MSLDSRQVLGLVWPRGAHLTPNRLGTIGFTGIKKNTTKQHVIFCFGAPLGETMTYTSRFTTFVEHLEKHFRLDPDRGYTGETRLVDAMQPQRVAAVAPLADSSYTEHASLNINVPKGCAVGDCVRVTLLNDDGKVDTFQTTIPEGFVTDQARPICCHFKTRKTLSHKGLRCAKVWKLGAAEPPFSMEDANVILANVRAKAPSKTDAELLAEKLKTIEAAKQKEQQKQLEQQRQLLEKQRQHQQLLEKQLEETEKKKRQQAALTAPPPAAAAPAKRALVVANDGTVGVAPEPKRQACGYTEEDPIVLD